MKLDLDHEVFIFVITEEKDQVGPCHSLGLLGKLEASNYGFKSFFYKIRYKTPSYIFILNNVKKSLKKLNKHFYELDLKNRLIRLIVINN